MSESTDLVPETASRPVLASMLVERRAGGGGAVFIPQNFDQVVILAQMMSKADAAVPKHLRGNPGACMAVVIRAVGWEMDPFSVATKTYFVNDAIAYESQLVSAVVNMRAPVKGRPRITYSGEGPELSCHFEYTMADGEVLGYDSPKWKDIPTKNSPLWKGDPQQQFFYYAARAWARRWVPEVLMGVYTPDEVVLQAQEDADRPRTFEALEERAGGGPAVADAEFEDKPKEATPAPKDPPKPRQRAAKAAEQPVVNAAAPDPSGEPASPTSGDGTATEAGAPGSGEPTTARDPDAIAAEAREMAKPEEPRPTSTASVPAAEVGQTSSDSATDASTASPPEASGPTEDQPPSSAAAPEANGVPAAFAAFAEVLAGATEWPNTIAPALAVLRKDPAWLAAPEEQRVRLHTLAFARLQELIREGYRFDFTDDLHAYRCYLDQEWDMDALEGHVRVVANVRNPKWLDLPTAGKVVFDKAVDAAKKRIAERAASGPGAEFS